MFAAMAGSFCYDQLAGNGMVILAPVGDVFNDDAAWGSLGIEFSVFIEQKMELTRSICSGIY
jgi:hypothetical protein